jgi:hypothetical protein
LNILKRGAVLVAAVTAALTVTTGPASAAGGWVDQGTFRNIFTCSTAGQQMVDAGDAATWQCLLEGDGRYHLYTVAGPWEFQASYEDFWDCIEAGQDMVADGSANSWQCLLENGLQNLYTV